MLKRLVLTDDPVLVGYVEALLRDRGMTAVVLDRALSTMHGAVGLVPQRIMVETGDWAAARLVLVEAGLGRHIADPEDD